MPVSQSAMVWQTSAATTETTETTSHRNTRKLEALATLAAVKTADDVCGFVAISTPTGKKGVQKGLLGRLLLPTRIHHHFCHPAMGWDHMGWYGMVWPWWWRWWWWWWWGKTFARMMRLNFLLHLNYIFPFSNGALSIFLLLCQPPLSMDIFSINLIFLEWFFPTRS